MVPTARITLAFAALGVIACSEATPVTAPAFAPPDAPLASSGATHTEDVFFATAACAADIGYSIRFGGPRTLVRHVSGNDETFSFGVQDFQGWRLPETTFDQTTVDYEVLGGAEMFNIKRDESGAFHVRIHEGTLVFGALDGSHKVIARHVIRTVPGRESSINTWSCRIVG